MPHCHSLLKRQERYRHAVAKGWIRPRWPIGAQAQSDVARCLPSELRPSFRSQCTVMQTALASHLLVTHFIGASDCLGRAFQVVRGRVLPFYAAGIRRLNHVFKTIRHLPLAPVTLPVGSSFLARLHLHLSKAPLLREPRPQHAQLCPWAAPFVPGRTLLLLGNRLQADQQCFLHRCGLLHTVLVTWRLQCTRRVPPQSQPALTQIQANANAWLCVQCGESTPKCRKCGTCELCTCECDHSGDTSESNHDEDNGLSEEAGDEFFDCENQSLISASWDLNEAGAVSFHDHVLGDMGEQINVAFEASSFSVGSAQDSTHGESDTSAMATTHDTIPKSLEDSMAEYGWSPDLLLGGFVQLQNLARRTDLNDELGVLVDYESDKDRFVVRLLTSPSSGNEVRVAPSRLRDASDPYLRRCDVCRRGDAHDIRGACRYCGCSAESRVQAWRSVNPEALYFKMDHSVSSDVPM